MKIFITGATGYVGNAVATNLARAGHQVYGLARSQEKAQALSSAEITPILGEMSKPETYLEVAGRCQVLIHCAADYRAQFMELDRFTVNELIMSAQNAGQPRLFVYTSGSWVYGNTGPAAVDEASSTNPPAMVAPRVETERIILSATRAQFRTIVLRPGALYGGPAGLTGSWFESAEKEGAARIVGDGSFHWGMVHVADLAEAYRLVVESSFGGQVFNLTDRSRFTVLECAQAASLAAGAGGAVNITPIADAARTLGLMAECLALDQHLDSSKAARLLGWQPRHGGFADGAERYYRSWKASR